MRRKERGADFALDGPPMGIPPHVVLRAGDSSGSKSMLVLSGASSGDSMLWDPSIEPEPLALPTGQMQLKFTNSTLSSSRDCTGVEGTG